MPITHPYGVTSSVASADVALLPASVWSAPAGMLFAYAADTDAWTSTTIVELPAPGIDAFTASSVTESLPAVAVIAPPQVVDAFGVVATTRPDGNASTSAPVSVSAVALAFESVMVSVLGVSTTTLAGAKFLRSLAAMV